MSNDFMTISDLPSKTALLDTDKVAVDDGVYTYKVTGAQLREFLKVNYLPMGTVVYSQSDRAIDNPGRLPLWSGLYIDNASQSYPDFYKWVKARAELCRTKEVYDALFEEYGEVPFYVVDEKAGSLRLPIIKNYIKAADSEGIKQGKAGLPNFTAGIEDTQTSATSQSFGETDETSVKTWGGLKAKFRPMLPTVDGGGLVNRLTGFEIDASLSNAMYGAADTVQPPHTTLYPWVCSHNYAISSAMSDNTALLNALMNAGGGGVKPITDLGLFTSADLEVNKAYCGIINGSVSIALPQEVDTEIENKITLSLKVLGASIIDYGVNTNINIKSLAAGDYSLFFSYNNNTSNWVCENLKHAAVESNLKLLVRFNGNTVDESQNPLILTPSRFVSAFPIYEVSKYGEQALAPTNNNDKNFLSLEGDKSKLFLSGDFTVRCWYRAAANFQHSMSLFEFLEDNFAIRKLYLSSEYIGMNSGFGLPSFQVALTNVNIGDWVYFAMTRTGSSVYIFANGKLLQTITSSAALELNKIEKIFKAPSVNSGAFYAMQEFVVKDSCDFTSDFTPPEVPFDLTDKYISDLHDDTKVDKTELATMQAQAVETATTSAAVYTDQKSVECKSYTDDKVETLQLVQYADVLPETGDTKYIYAVPQLERTIDGQLIVVLFIWTGTEWAAVGALSTSIDLTEYLKKTEAATLYLPLSGGQINGNLSVKSSLRLMNSSGVQTLIINASDINYIGLNSKNLGAPYGWKILRNTAPDGTGSYSDAILWSGDKAVPNGLATLDASGKVPAVQIPQTILDRLAALEAEIATLKGAQNV